MAFAIIDDPNKIGEMKPFVLSPSNMSTYKQCPRRFQGQSITGEIKWQFSQQKSRGTLVHSVVEAALRHGVQKVTNWPDGLDIYYTQNKVQEARQQVADGGMVFIEHEMVIDNNFNPANDGWWADDAILRAKADSIIVPVDNEQPVKIIDIKTGKKWDTEDFQLRVEALLAHLIYKKPTVEYEYWYVDIGDTESGFIDFRYGFTPVQDIIDLMRDMKLAIKNKDFPVKKNTFCKFCGLDGCPNYKRR